MSRLLFDTAGAVIFDPSVANRNATRTSLYQLGFRNVELAPTIDFLAKFVVDYTPDLVIAEMTGEESAVCKLVQSIRKGDLGNNPFVVVVVTTWQRDGSSIAKAINSGADDLVARPISTRMMGDRIRLQIERRKGFVVTHNYIGPDRRRDMERPGLTPIEVPNTLRIRAAEGLPAPEANLRIRNALEAGKTALAGAKLRRDVVQLCVQWRLLERQTPGTNEYFDNAVRVGRVAAMVRDGLPDEGAQDAAELCAAITQSVEIIASLKPMQDEAHDFDAPLRQLGYAALRLGQIYAPGQADNEQLAAQLSQEQGAQIEAA
jgi:DNA-binding response OmpR family regulator